MRFLHRRVGPAPSCEAGRRWRSAWRGCSKVSRTAFWATWVGHAGCWRWPSRWPRKSWSPGP